MTVKELKKTVVARLTPVVGHGEAAAMAGEVLRHFTGLDAVGSVIHGSRVLEPETVEAVDDVVRRVAGGEPLQYVLGYAWFHGMELRVSPEVLIPRPETSQLVDIVVDRVGGASDLRVLDVGTGSGAIAIALARDLAFAQVTAVDISDGALAVARANAVLKNVQIDFLQADALRMHDLPCLGLRKFDVIISNPPYIAEYEKNDMEARVYDHEPGLALFVAADDPLIFYRSIAQFALGALDDGGWLLFEINPLFAKELEKLLRRQGWNEVEIVRDFRGVNRFAVCRR